MALFKNGASLSVSAFTSSILGQLSETVNSSGYKGRVTLGTQIVESVSGSSSKWSIGSIVFSASTIGDISSIQYAVIYESVSGKLLCFCRLSTAAFSVTTGNTLTISNASGVFVLSGGATE